MISQPEVFAVDGDVLLLFHEVAHPVVQILSSSEAGDGDEDSTTQQQPVVPNVIMKVSSHNLRQASLMFKAMFTYNLQESIALQTQGKPELELLEDDAKAFRIVMAVIHNKSKDIPRSMGFKTLLEVCLVVDKYKMDDAIDFHLKTWLSAIVHRRPGPKDRDVEQSQWLFVFQVCGAEAEFQILSRDICRTARSSYLDLPVLKRLPLPLGLLESIMETRAKLLGHMMATIQAQIEIYSSHKTAPKCRRRHGTSAGGNIQEGEACRCLLLGSLIRFSTRPQIRDAVRMVGPANSVAGVRKFLHDYELMTLSNLFRSPNDTPEKVRALKDCEGPGSKIKSQADIIYHGIQGWDFKSFEPVMDPTYITLSAVLDSFSAQASASLKRQRDEQELSDPATA